jgi:hypothetical protein
VLAVEAVRDVLRGYATACHSCTAT